MPPPMGGDSGEYVPLTADPESAALTFDMNYTYDSTPPLKRRIYALTQHHLFRPVIILFTFLFAISVARWLFFAPRKGLPASTPSLPTSSSVLALPKPTAPADTTPNIWYENAVNFSTSPKPAYLDTPLDKPLVIRLAIIARPDGFKRRQAIREAVLAGVPAKDVKIDYRFFVAKAHDGVEGLPTKLRLAKENNIYNDVTIIDEFHDIGNRISEKRFAALKWTNSMPHDQYDYSITMDSDTFCRFGALARRLKHLHPDLKPRENPIMIGRMGKHLLYFENTVPDGNKKDTDEDYIFKGPWYKYPIGLGYILSSNITKTILDLNPPVSHHINYPMDDVMIGSWIAALKYYHDPDARFNTTERDPVPDQPVHPKPLLPYPIDTAIYDDQVGFHDVRGDDEKQRKERPIAWDSVCIHRMKPEQMLALRKMEAIKGEWDEVVV